MWDSSQEFQATQRGVVDRGQRPRWRGWSHFGATLVALVAGPILVTYSWLRLPSVVAVGVTIYIVGLVMLFAVSAAYHLGPWKSLSTVQRWRRADHSMIAVFIACAYTALFFLASSSSQTTWMLVMVWGAALLSVIASLFSTDNHRWFSGIVYLLLGWSAVLFMPQLLSTLDSSVVWLLILGGVVYSFGAVIYCLRWPRRDAVYFGFHEVFHAATIFAAILHFVAVCLLVVGLATQ